MQLRPFQRDFERAVVDPRYDTVALSGPRSLGKTFSAARILDPSHDLPATCCTSRGKEYILGAASIEQARLTYAFIRQALEPTREYRWIDSATRLGATHIPTNTKLRAISSNAKTSFGLVNVPIVVIDEPGALEIVGGQMLADSLFTAQGKVGSRLKLILIGTLAPTATSSGHWWYDLVTGGTKGTTHVQYFHGDLETWDQWPTIRQANPLVAVDADFRRKLLEERDAARRDTREKARFLSYRLNLPTRDESEMLLTVDDWERVEARPTPDPDGRPIVGIDLGGGRAWSAAVAVYPNGLIDALAVAPGIPSIDEQEKRDRVPRGTYQRLVDDGLLLTAEGLRVPPPRLFVGRDTGRMGADLRKWYATASDWPTCRMPFRNGARIEDRVVRWSEASADIRALRKGAKDGPFAVTRSARALIAASLSRCPSEER